jgi:hypothetical protein
LDKEKKRDGRSNMEKEKEQMGRGAATPAAHPSEEEIEPTPGDATSI